MARAEASARLPMASCSALALRRGSASSSHSTWMPRVDRPTQFVDESPVGDREDERAELRLVPAEAVERIEDGEEDLAREVLGLAGATRLEERHDGGSVVDPEVGARPRCTRLRREQHAGEGVAARGTTVAAAGR